MTWQCQTALTVNSVVSTGGHSVAEHFSFSGKVHIAVQTDLKFEHLVACKQRYENRYINMWLVLFE